MPFFHLSTVDVIPYQISKLSGYGSNSCHQYTSSFYFVNSGNTFKSTFKFMASQRTYLRIVNNTPVKMLIITVSDIDDYDWDDNTHRPDINFHNSSIETYQLRVQQEELNYFAGTCWYKMHIIFQNGDAISFKRDQKEALGRSNSSFGLEGYSSHRYIALQSARGDVNTINISPFCDSKTWMNNIAGSTNISWLNLPGTHDTCALYGGPAYKCQSLSLREQLEAGVRYLDIRCRHYYDTFPIHHGVQFQHLTFDIVVDICNNFLLDNPTECIVMSVKKEYNDTGVTRTFEDTFDVFMARKPGVWYLEDRVPALHEVRGKIVLLRRFDAARLPKGVAAIPDDWADNLTFFINNAASTLRIQDEYNVPTIFNVDDKWDHAATLMSEAASSAQQTWFINYCSGAIGAFPINIAKGIAGVTGMNDFLFNFLLPQTRTRLGTLVVDFPEYPGNGLLTAIINSNTFNRKRPVTFLVRLFHRVLEYIRRFFR